MAAKRGLGKGIDAMISGDDTKAKKVVKEVIKEVDTIDINKIEPNRPAHISTALFMKLYV